jgi:uncharacterized RDD family membrane protein YckC
MGRSKVMSILWIVLGVILVAFFLLIDKIGLGNRGFGPRQISGVVVGAVLLIFGFVRLLMAKKKTTPSET